MALALASVATLSAAFLLVAAPAGAVVKKVPTGVGSEEVTVGLQPHSVTLHVGASSEAKQFANSTGAPVLPTNKTYAIYWDPTDNYHGDWQGVIDTFFQNLGAGSGSLDSVYAVDAQYTDAANQHADYASTFQGAYTDTDPYPSSGKCTDPHPLLGNNYPWGEPAEITCLTNAQIETELKLFIADHKLSTGMGTIFYMLTPPGVTVCLDKGGPEGHCSDFNGTLNEIGLYEEEKNTYPERVVKYNKEYKTYEKELVPYEKLKTKYEAEVEKYNKTKEKDKESGEPDTEAEPVAPTKPTKPIEPALPKEPTGYKDYQNSFCSYHSDINPGNPVNGGPGTILYASIPWIAGGLADWHINDAVSGYDCQDGGYDPSSKPIEEKEKVKEKTAKEEEEFSEKTPEEKSKQEEAEIAAGPHQQEPNQVSCPSPDGYCDTGLADLIISQIGSEQQNIVTDPLLDSWKDPSGDEVTDECRNFFAGGGVSGSSTANPETFAGTLFNQTLGGGAYYLNDSFNLAALKLPYPGIPCLGGIDLEPKFTAPNTVNSGEVVGFDGMESYLTLNEGTAYTGSTPKVTYATYKWNFGDGSPEVTGFAPGAPTQNSPETTPCPTWLTPCAASVFHSYQYGGAYEVTLTVTDTGGNVASVTESIKVDGPANPAEKGSGGSGGSGSGSEGGSGTTPGVTPPATSTTGSTPATSTATSGGSSPPKPIPGPVASAAVLSRSLTTALKKGLVIGYSVNEQVAGQFQVLLAASIAKRIGLHGAPATDMPPGSEPAIVIGKAILITTKGGSNTVKIELGKKTAAKLRKLRSVTLTIRLVVRNASSHSPLTTTVISTVTLSR
jgi:hypothetical protein